jgi:hypothetical protein
MTGTDEGTVANCPMQIVQRALTSDEEPGRAVHPCQLPGLAYGCRSQRSCDETELICRR